MKARGEDPVEARRKRREGCRRSPPNVCPPALRRLRRHTGGPGVRGATPRCSSSRVRPARSGLLARHAPLIGRSRLQARRASTWGRTASRSSRRTEVLHGGAGPGDRSRRPRRQGERDRPRRGAAPAEEAQAERSGSRAGSAADRWVVEQRVIHAQTQLDVATGASDIRQFRGQPGAGPPRMAATRRAHDPPTDGQRSHRCRGLEAAKAFFAELGLELEGEATNEGRWVDRVVGLDDVVPTS